MTIVYLAYSSSADETLRRHAEDEPVDLLVAFPELDRFLRVRQTFNVRRWCMDSGAFSAWNSGKTIDLDAYIEACKAVDACEIFGLDVIGDWKATARNLEQMWSEGISAIPTYHQNQPTEALEWCLRWSGKIALGGIARSGKGRKEWILRCFGRAWPRRIHGFAMASREMIELAPFDSVDASSWVYAPAKMGHWAGFTGKQMRVSCRGVNDYWVEVQEHQRRARWAEFKWRNDLRKVRARGGIST